LNSGPYACALTTWVTLPALFYDMFFRDRVSWIICPGVGLKTWSSSWSLPPE
jgi:hypothetical protein